MIQTNLINLHPNEYRQEFYYYPSELKLNRCVETCNTLNYLSNEVFVPKKSEELRKIVFNRRIGTNQLKKLISKHIYANVNVHFREENVIHISGGLTINVDVIVKNVMYVKKITFGIFLDIVMKMENIYSKYFGWFNNTV